MTSPLPALPGSSPFPFPLASISPFAIGPSPIPLHQGHSSSSTHNQHPTQHFNTFPSPLNPASFSTGLTPLAFANPLLPSASSHLYNGTGAGDRQQGKNGESSRTEGKGTGNDVGFEDVRKGLADFGGLLDRAISLIAEIRRVEDGLFDRTEEGGRSEGMQVGMGGLTKLELLHLEYTQILSTLLHIGTTSLVASLPVPATSEIQDASQKTLADLTQLAESRASLEFQRREAIRSSSKAVLDVLKQR